MALNQSMAEEEAGEITVPRAPGATGLAGAKRTEFRIEPLVPRGEQATVR